MLVVLALVAAAQVSSPLPKPRVRGRPIAMAAEDIPGDLKATLVKRFRAVDALKQGLFNEDITSIVAPFFPVGQPLEETERIIRAQKLGALKRFKGDADSADVTMFVTHFNLMSETFSNVYVVLDFDYVGASKDTMTLKRMKAFLRASNM